MTNMPQDSPNPTPSMISDSEIVMAESVVPVAELSRPQPESIVVAELAQASPLINGEANPQNGTGFDEPSAAPRSWVFCALDWTAGIGSHLFGILSVLMLLAITSSIPLVQFASFGYLLEVSGRLGRGQKLRDAMVGLRKASVLGGALLGIWLCLIPVQLISNIWFDAFLIDPNSNQTAFMRFLQVAGIALTIGHIGAALICGGKLRYFFWPLVAPFSFAIWAVRRLAGVRLFRQVLDFVCGWLSPNLSNDICNAQPVGDWFLPAIVWNRWFEGNLYTSMRDQLWEFFIQLRPVYYFMLGLKGFLGTLAWLIVPTGLLVLSAYAEEEVVAGFAFAFGVLFAIPIFAGLPFLQVHFATDGALKRFAEPWNVFKNFGRAPLAHWLALLLILALSIPLFLLKIERIPQELMWSLSLVFVMFSWPTKLMAGLAYRRGASKEKPSWWFIRYPLVLLTAPISLSFALIFTGPGIPVGTAR